MQITITGKDSDGRIVATDKTDSARKADEIAAAWRSSGLEVETETK